MHHKHANFSRYTRSSVCWLSPVALVLQLLSACGQTVSLTNANSVVEISTNSSAGAYTWSVDGVDQLSQQWFWFRVGSVDPEQSLNSLSTPTVSTNADGRGMTAFYSNHIFTIQVDYHLTGGQEGSGRSSLSSSVQINNLTINPLEFHFFDYADFDLGGTAGSDSTAVRFSPNQFFVADQSDVTASAPIIQETVNSPAASHTQAEPFAVILSSLNDGSPSTLDDTTTAGPGDTTYGFQWDFTLLPTNSFLIQTVRAISPVPPMTITITSVEHINKTTVLTWTAVPSVTYSVLTTTNATTPVWTTLTSGYVSPGTSASYTDDGATDRMRLYRVRSP